MFASAQRIRSKPTGDRLFKTHFLRPLIIATILLFLFFSAFFSPLAINIQSADIEETAPQTNTDLLVSSALLIGLEGAIGPALEAYIIRGFKQASTTKAGIIILQIDTPGGLDSTTRNIIKAILASERPIIGFITPSGARGASAGAYILLACHVAAMSPGTNVGSATPVMLGGLPTADPNTADKNGQVSEQNHPTMKDKIINDARAYMRTLAHLRGRPSEIAEQFVSKALNYTEEEALQKNLIDLTATDPEDLLNKLDQRVIRLSDGTVNMHTSGAMITIFEATWQETFLAFLTNPNIAYLFIVAGFYGLFIEGTNPGLMLPGIAGAISLIMGLYALQFLPVNYAGLALITLGVALMISEAFMPSFGAFGIGGVVSFALGSIMLVESDIPDFQISPILIGTISLTTGGIFLFVAAFAIRAWKRPVASGSQAMIGLQGQILKWKQQRGTVRVRGEVWAARSDIQHSDPEHLKQFKPGSLVKVKHIDGLTLEVIPGNSPPYSGE